MAATDTKKKMLGEMLVAGGLIKEDQLKKALDEQKKRGGRVGELLVDLGFLTEYNLASFLGRQLQIPYVEIDKQLVDTDTVRLIPAAMARRLTAIPLYRDKEAIVVAMADPLNIFGIDDIRKAAGREVRQVVATRSDIMRAIDRLYGVTMAIDDAVMDFAGVAGETEAGVIPDVVSEDAPVVKLVSMVIAQAIMERASDIHIVPEGKSVKIRYRVDGVLREVKTFQREMHAPIVSRIKILADMDIAEKRIPQDGRFQARITHSDTGPVVTSVFRERSALRMDGDTTVDLRVSTLPVIQGETVVMRILDRTQIIQNLEGLNFSPDLLERYKGLIQRPYGMILVTGPTGSGKTTTLYASVNALDKKKNNIVTVEDPVEYQIMGVNQLQVNPKAGVTFAGGLRSILRQDPDVIMVGEIRDRETAEIAIHAALTGHIVFSTLHTNDAAGAATRLTDMGIEPFLIASSAIGIAAQRLVRKVCDHCKKPYAASPELLKSLGLAPGAVTFYRGEGCAACGNEGYKGRIGIYELMQMNETIRTLIIAKASSSAIKAAALQAGFRSLRQEGLLKAAEGITTVEEVLRVTQEAEGI
ncbi:MAG: type II secretion system protein GspE [Nitrospirae bacterium GWC2_57_13]|nr:MAG: type II secretion system protein GspE [Nitrospirae bacterium GWC2_57_13]